MGFGGDSLRPLGPPFLRSADGHLDPLKAPAKKHSLLSWKVCHPTQQTCESKEETFLTKTWLGHKLNLTLYFCHVHQQKHISSSKSYSPWVSIFQGTSYPNIKSPSCGTSGIRFSSANSLDSRGDLPKSSCGRPKKDWITSLVKWLELLWGMCGDTGRAISI